MNHRVLFNLLNIIWVKPIIYQQKAVLLTAVSASLALGLRAEAEEAMWAVGCGGGALRRPGEVWYYVRRPSAIARRGGSGGGRRAGEVRATAAGRSAL